MTSALLPARSTGSHLFDSRVFLWSLGSLLLLLLWDGSGLDLWLAHWFGSAQGFPLQDHWLWRGVLHDGIRPLPWLLELGLLAAIVRPIGTLRQLAFERRVSWP